MKLDEAINLCRGTGLSGWEMVGYVNRLVNENMEYSVDIPFTMHRKAFRIGKGYCVQQAFCVRDILKTLGYRVQLVYCRKAIFKDTGTTSGHTWCRVSIDKKSKMCAHAILTIIPERLTLFQSQRLENMPGRL